MAYDQGPYQAPQRLYNSRAAQPSSQAYDRPSYPPTTQDYPLGGSHSQYAHGDYDYEYNGSRNAYAQNYDHYQQSKNEARGGNRGQHTRQNQEYPSRQEHYGNGNGRGRGNDQSIQNMSNARGGFDNKKGGEGRGYPYGNSGLVMGREYPRPLDRSISFDSSPSEQRKPMAPAPLSPQEISWDTPFPAFPGTKKKTSASEEQKIAQQIVSMDISETRNQKGGRGNISESGQRDPSGYDAYSRPSGESQRGAAPRAYPPQQAQVVYRGPQGQRGGTGPAPGYGRPQPNGYVVAGYDQGYGPPSSTPASPMKGSFGHPSRSMTMPNDLSMNTPYRSANATPPHPQPGPMDSIGASAPYHGPVGRGPHRPMTASGNRQPLQGPHPHEPHQLPYPNEKDKISDERTSSHQPKQSISDLYDAYYEPYTQPGTRTSEGDTSFSLERADIDNLPMGLDNQPGIADMENHHQRGSGRPDPMPLRQRVNGYPLMSRTKSQPDFRAQVQPQSAIYEVAGDAPPLPNEFLRQGYLNGRYEQYGNHTSQPPRGQSVPPMGRGYDASEKGAPQGLQEQRQNGPPGRPLPNGTFPHKNIVPDVPRTNSLPNTNSQANPDALPAHPVPIRPGLSYNSVSNQVSDRPPPVRNYTSTGLATSSQGQPSSTSPDSSSSESPPVTLDELERLKVWVKNDPNDQAAQLTLARKYIEASEVLIGTISDQKSRNKARERYIFDAHKLLKKLAAVQNAEAMFYLADCYGRGSLGLEIDNKEAFYLYQSAAKAGHAAAAYRTAVCCEIGNEEGGGTRKDPLKAVQWYKRAATLGDTPAMYKMGMIQLKGLLGQSQSPQDAIVWLKRAAERANAENPHALHELGLLYEAAESPSSSGVVTHDEASALSLFTQAAELGYKFSQFRLGTAYEYGLFNLSIDPRLSIMWYSRAAVQEEHQSELALSGWYLTGSDGVLQQSDTEAYLWARKAAIAGLAKAEYAMGYFTEVGIGTPADLEAAKRWYWRAAAQNFPKARERLEDLKRGGSKPQLKSRERISRSKVGKHNEGECTVM